MRIYNCLWAVLILLFMQFWQLEKKLCKILTNILCKCQNLLKICAATNCAEYVHKFSNRAACQCLPAFSSHLAGSLFPLPSAWLLYIFCMHYECRCLKIHLVCARIKIISHFACMLAKSLVFHYSIDWKTRGEHIKNKTAKS